MDSILHALGPGATKTQIMYKAYLSFSQLKEYLTVLQEKGLLSYEDGSHLYRLTEKGLRFMNAYDEIEELVSAVNEKKSVNDEQVVQEPEKRETFNF